MRNRAIAVFSLLFLCLTVSVAGRWNELNAEQQVFAELANQIAAKKQSIKSENSNTDFDAPEAGNGTGQELKKQKILPEYQELVSENPDFAGWLTIDKTAVSYPVMQTPDEAEYYLHRNFKGEESFAGTPFVGTGDMQDSKNTLFVYGHHMKNGTMFAELLKYQEKKFWNSHRTIRLDTRYEHREYEIFAVFFADEKEWNHEGGLFADFDLKNREKKIEELKKIEMYETGIIPDVQDSLLFLVTCSARKSCVRFVAAAYCIR